ncbi:MAG: hypothetical protein ABIW80_08330 [Lapillicoccus sp.]
MGGLRGLRGDVTAVLVGGSRLLGGHWPWLLAIYLLGAAAHGGALWLAVVVSREHETLAGLILPLAPIASLLALILMLRRLGPSLRHARFSSRGSRDPGRFSGRLALVASLLIPFLTLYSTQGYLQEDRQAFTNAAVVDEIFGSASIFHGGTVNPDRALLVSSTAALVVVILVTLAIRRLLNQLGLPDRHVAFAIAAGYVEVFWLFSVASSFDQGKTAIRDWVADRVAVHWVTDHVDALVTSLGVLGAPLRVALDAAYGLYASFTAVLLVPVAWLVIGAVVFGRTLDRKPLGLRPPGPWGHRVERARTRLRTLPAPARKVTVDVGKDLKGRFGDLGDALRLLVASGALLIVLFCLVFFLARYAEYAAAEVLRVVVGPRSLDTGLAFAPWVSVVTRGVYTVILIVLVAATVDRVVGRQEAARADSAGAEDDPQQGGSPAPVVSV